MATTADFIEFVLEQLDGIGAVRAKKMFGEYMVYLNDKPVLLVCDDTVYVKMLDAVAAEMQGAGTGIPYPHAKEHYVLDIDNRQLSRAVVVSLEKVTPVPRKKVKKQRTAQ